MHKTNVTVVKVQPQGGQFIVSGSSDGYVKFWRKTTEAGQIEFVKQYRAHADAPVVDAVFSSDGRSLAVISTEKTVKIFDVESFDMVGILDLAFVPAAVSWTEGSSIVVYVACFVFPDALFPAREPTAVVPTRIYGPLPGT